MQHSSGSRYQDLDGAALSMWSGLTQFADALKEQAESVVRDAGLDNQLVRFAPSCLYSPGEDCNATHRYRKSTTQLHRSAHVDCNVRPMGVCTLRYVLLNRSMRRSSCWARHLAMTGTVPEQLSAAPSPLRATSWASSRRSPRKVGLAWKPQACLSAKSVSSRPCNGPGSLESALSASIRAGWEGAEPAGNGGSALLERDSGGFDEVSLGSPPDKPAQMRSMPPSLAAVAKTLISHEGAEAGSAAAEARQLRAENARLKQRLAAVENVNIPCSPCAIPYTLYLPFQSCMRLALSRMASLGSGTCLGLPDFCTTACTEGAWGLAAIVIAHVGKSGAIKSCSLGA
jgi:hypothetical protein